MQFLQNPNINVFPRHCSSQKSKLRKVAVCKRFVDLPVKVESELNVEKELIFVELKLKVEFVAFRIIVG